jgi:uncharacterized protein (DUF433 family)
MVRASRGTDPKRPAEPRRAGSRHDREAAHIVSAAGVRGGHARVEGTRIGVHDVVAYFLLGSSLEEVAARFPDLSRAQIYECLAYYEDHRSEIESLALPQTKITAA